MYVDAANPVYGGQTPEFRGLSTDEKPTDCPNGSVFFEMDTGKAYTFDVENSQWREL